MEPEIMKLAIFILVAVVVYWLICIFLGSKETPKPTTALDYFIAGRNIKPLWYVFAATATSFSGWTFISHPGMIFSHGFQASLISFYAITIAFTGVLFLKRQWLLGKKYDFITPGDMFSSYFRSAPAIQDHRSPPLDGIKIMVFVVALLFSLLYLAVQLRASGYLIGTLTGFQGEQSEKIIMLILTGFLLWYVLPKGLKRVAYVDQLQFFLLVTGMIAIGGIVIWQVGSWDAFKQGMIHLADYDYHRAPNTEQYSHYFAVPGAIQWDVWNFNRDTSQDGWTGMMLLTFMLALMGIQSSPAFTMWAFSNETPKAFAPQQVWASSFFIGLVMLIFTTIQGIGPHFLGADSEFAQAHPEIVKMEKNLVQPPHSLPKKEDNKSDEVTKKKDTNATEQDVPKKWETDRLIPNIILSVKDIKNLHYWVGNLLIAFLAIAALAAMQSTASSYISTFGGIATRDFARGFSTELEKDCAQIFWGRWLGAGIVIVALVFASLSKGQEIALLGGLAVACGLQMWPALVGICWWPFLTRQGIFWGIIAGLLAVLVTENPSDIISTLLGLGANGWMRYPLTIHSAGWGLLTNFIVAFVVSCMTQNEKETAHRKRYHRFLYKYASVPKDKKKWKFMAVLLVIIWFTFAIGPGVVIGNDFFGNPNEPHSWWFFGLVPIWAWQAGWWVIGVFMMWFLAYYLEMSTMPDKRLEKFKSSFHPCRKK